MSRTPIKDLYADCLNVSPVTVEDWQAIFRRGIDEGQDGVCWEAVRCDKCNAVSVICDTGGDAPHNEIDSDSDCDGHMSMSQGPAMNYWYPLNDTNLSPDTAAAAIVDLPLCVVCVDGAYGLALTGGGMDLSWEICHAYMLLGELPPVHFDLPRMSGKGTSPDDRWIIAGLTASWTVLQKRAVEAKRRLATITTDATNDAHMRFVARAKAHASKGK